MSSWRKRERLAAGDPDHLAHQIDAGDHLGHRMLDLDAGVHLDEVEVVADVVVEVLERAGAAVVDRLGERHRGRAEPLARRLVDSDRRRRLLPDLLAAALQRAFALEAVDDVAAVAEHLHLDVAGALDQLLDIEPAVAEGGLRLGAAPAASAGANSVGVAGDADAAAAAAGRRLDHHRKADLLDDRAAPPRGRRSGRSLPGTVGTPAAAAAARPATLSPIRRIVSPRGPTKMRPAASTASAKPAFSARKP